MTNTNTNTDIDTGRSVPRRLRDLFGVVGLGYLVLCVVLVVWALVVTVTDSSGESMAGVIPVLATAPVSLVFLVLPDNTVMLIAAVALGAAVNAAIIGWCARALRRGGRTD
ncbi:MULTISPECIES: SCO4225 family membrane protein [unclassified Streptomyces]|uniref:SCO4225 family membrane protein n=1 Tax=unclassified Streptomyces TaxID=2593676 RepID=UPI003829C264